MFLYGQGFFVVVSNFFPFPSGMSYLQSEIYDMRVSINTSENKLGYLQAWSSQKGSLAVTSNSITYGILRFNAAFTRALQLSLT